MGRWFIAHRMSWMRCSSTVTARAVITIRVMEVDVSQPENTISSAIANATEQANTVNLVRPETYSSRRPFTLMARSHTRIQTWIWILIQRGFPMATVVLCLNFTLH